MSETDPGISPESRVRAMGDKLFAEMQTPEAQSGVRRALGASPEELADIVASINDGTVKAEIDDATGHDPDLAV